MDSTTNYSVCTPYHVAAMRFGWNERKNPTNRRKHGVSFEEAQTAFFDENARVIPDPEHSDDEGDSSFSD